MTLSAASPVVTDLEEGQTWAIRVKASELPVVAILLPDDTAGAATVFEYIAAATGFGPGCYVAKYVTDRPGRHLATVTTTDGGQLTFQAFVTGVTTGAGLPTYADLDTYLGGVGEHSWSDADLTESLDVESAQQRRVCRIPAAYPADLRDALLRRAARRLEMKRQLTEQPRTDSDFGTPALIPPGRDSEIRRLETPFRKLTIG